MKDLKIHSNYNGNLLSIKSVENTYSDKNYIRSIIKSLSSLADGCFYVEASRPNYDYDSIDIALQLESILDYDDNLKYTDFEISFNTINMNDRLLEILPILWFAFEHICLCFLMEDKLDFNIKRKPWYEITMQSKSFVLFKGIEEDVIWIGKNEELEFHIDYEH